jgi:hypothetical protein
MEMQDLLDSGKYKYAVTEAIQMNIFEMLSKPSPWPVISSRIHALILGACIKNGLALGDGNNALKVRTVDDGVTVWMFGIKCFGIKELKNSTRMEIDKVICNAVISSPVEFPEKGPVKIVLNIESDIIGLIDVSKLYMYTFDRSATDGFACCHMYTECSDAIDCVHPDIMHTAQCMYYRNLRDGKVFYGKNKNI